MINLKISKITILFFFTLILFVSCKPKTAKLSESTHIVHVSLSTTMGEVLLELYPDKAPVSVNNFIDYVKSAFYTGCIFHRVIDGFMIQGGGYDTNLNEKETNPAIVNEAKNGLGNVRGTIAYARTNVINSATSQFFINLMNNNRLDYKGESQTAYGYSVFGKVIQGMEVVDAIGKVKTGSKNRMNDVPINPIVILSASIQGK